MREELKYSVIEKNPITLKEFLAQSENNKEEDYQAEITVIKSIIVEKKDAEKEAKKIIKSKNKTFIGAWKVLTEEEVKKAKKRQQTKADIIQDLGAVDSDGAFADQFNLLRAFIKAWYKSQPKELQNEMKKKHGKLIKAFMEQDKIISKYINTKKYE